MKTYKPYLSLSKKASKFQMGVIVTAQRAQTITNIRQEEVKTSSESYWGVIVTLSDSTQLVNGPENPVFSAMVDIALDKSESYKKIVCSTEISLTDGELGTSTGDNTTIDFGDAGT